MSDIIFFVLLSALYFPQSDLQLKLPYLKNNDRLIDNELTLVILRTLRNDSVILKNPKYQIVNEDNSGMNLDPKTGEIIYDLHSIIKKKGKLKYNFLFVHLIEWIIVSFLLKIKGATETIVIRAKERENNDATMEMKILPVEIKAEKLNCADFTRVY